jgi:hypothetical protein
MTLLPSLSEVRVTALVRSVVLLGSLFAVEPSFASVIWDWTYTSTAYSGSGTMSTGSTTAPSTDFYLVTDITGTWNNVPITGLAPSGTFGGNDNFLAPSLPQLDFSGLAFTTETGEYNMFYNGSQYEVCLTAGCTGGVGPGSFSATIATTPEPSFAPFGAIIIMGITSLKLLRLRRHRT